MYRRAREAFAAFRIGGLGRLPWPDMNPSIFRALACAVCAALVSGCVARRQTAFWRPAVSVSDPAEASLRKLSDAGVEALEIGLRDVMKLPPDQRLAKCAEIRAAARRADLEIWSVHIPFGKDWDISATDAAGHATAMANVRACIPVCRRLGARKAVIHASAEPIKAPERQARLDTARRSLHALAREYAAAGVQLAVENLPRSCLGNTSAEILWLIDGEQRLGVCFDTNHTLKEAPEDFARKVGRRIVTLHVADYDGEDERHWKPGEGIIDWRALVTALREAGYRGPFLFETGRSKYGGAPEPHDLVEFARYIQEAAP